MAKEQTDYFLRFKKQRIVLEVFGGKSEIQSFNKDIRDIVKAHPGMLVTEEYGNIISPLKDFEK